jgi:hypothetical protein
VTWWLERLLLLLLISNKKTKQLRGRSSMVEVLDRWGSEIEDGNCKFMPSLCFKKFVSDVSAMLRF